MAEIRNPIINQRLASRPSLNDRGDLSKKPSGFLRLRRRFLFPSATRTCYAPL